MLHGDGWRYYRGGPLEEDDELVTKEDLSDPGTCLTTSVHMLRDSLRVTGSLRGYTGEPSHAQPKAQERLRRANRYFLLNPPPVLDAEVLREREER